MNLIKVFIKRPVFTFMLFLALSVLGIISLFNLPFDLLPDITKPEITIVTMYEGASPEIVEREITKNVEEGVYSVKGVMDIRSISTEGKSLVTVYFHRSNDMKGALLQLREKMDEIYWSFPDDAERPRILTTGPTSRPVMGIWVKGDREIIKEVITRRFEQVNGVGEARILGLRAKQIKIIVDNEVLEAFNITVDEIKVVLKAYNITVPAGTVREGSYTFPLRFISQTVTTEEVGNIPLKNGLYKLKDIAEIVEVEEERKSSIFYNTKEGYFIQIFKEWDVNSVKVSNEVKDLIKAIQEDYPEIEFEISYDDAEFITTSIKEILLSLLIGSILAFIAIFFFTGNRKIPFILAISMPLSIIPAFFFFFLWGVSINTMTLAGLALAVGMLVDSSIVVLENIIKRQDAYTGAKEVILAVSTSILTTIAVFFPVIYIHGIAGMMLKPLSISVIVTLLLSLLVAFSILPILSKKISKEKDAKIYSFIHRKFIIFIDILYNNKFYVFIFSVFLLLCGLFIFFFIKKEALPPTRSELIVNYELPFNTSIEETEKIGKRISQYFINKGASCLLSVGEIDPFGLSHTGNGQLRIKGYNSIPPLSELFSDYDNISFSYEDFNPVLAVFSSIGKIAVRGYYDTEKEGEVIFRVMKDNLEDAIFNYSEKIPVYEIIPRERVLSALNISTDEILSSLKLFTGGEKIIDVERGEEKISILLKTENRIRDIKNLRINSYPLYFLAEINIEETTRSIIRYNGKRCIEADIPFTGNLDIPKFPFKTEFGGELQEYEKAQKSAFFAFLVAMFLVFLILASFYESLKLPFLIMIAVPFAAAGFLISLILSATSLNIISLIGLVVLVGIVVNDSIVLVDRAEALRKEKIKLPGKRAAIDRMRPILMTTLTTVFGLIPFSLGDTLHAPLGRGVIGGIIISTFITLVLIPIVYDKVYIGKKEKRRILTSDK